MIKPARWRLLTMFMELMDRLPVRLLPGPLISLVGAGPAVRRKLFILLARLLTRFTGKLVFGLLIILVVVCPLAYGAYGIESFVVCLAAGFIAFLNHIVSRIIVRNITDLSTLDEIVGADFGAIVSGSVVIGLGLGFGAGLGMLVADGFNKLSFTGGFVKGFAIGFTVAFLLGLLFGLRLVPNVDLEQGLEESRIGVFVGALIYLNLLITFPLGMGGVFHVRPLLVLSLGLVIGSVGTLVTYVTLRMRRGLFGLKATILALVQGLVYATIFASFFILGSGLNLNLLGGVAVSVGGVLGVNAGTWLGWLLGDKVKPGIQLLPALRPYLWTLRWPTALFALSYSAIVLLYAGFYASIDHWYPDGSGKAFVHAQPTQHLTTQTFWDFAYFSLNTITSLGYSDIQAASPLAQTLASSEVLVGIGWTVVIFAGIVAYMEPRFRKTWVEEGNKQIAAQLAEAIFSNDSARMNELFAPDYVIYGPANPNGKHDLGCVGRYAARLRYALSDLQVTVDDQFAKGSNVITRWNVGGTYAGRHGGNRRTNGYERDDQRKVSGIQVVNIDEGRITEAWYNSDPPEWVWLT